MIFTKDFLFLHVPKTAGMSVSNALLKTLSGKVYYAVQEGHAKSAFGVKVLVGSRHQTLVGADAYFEKMGLEHRLETFRYIMTMVRNPYEMEVSRFHYLRKGHPWDKGPAQKLAVAGDFAGFVAGSSWWFDFKDYYTLDGRIPDNLYIVRYEGFEQTMQLTFGSCFKKPFKTKTVNRSHDTDYREYFSQELEEQVYRKYQWIFDKGFYPREVFSSKPGMAQALPDLST